MRIQLDFTTGYDLSTTVRHLRDGCSDGCSVIRLLAEQIEAQTKPPRIPEPGWGGAVEAGLKGRAVDNSRRTWVRTADTTWHDGAATYTAWSELVDPTLVRDGIEDGA